MLRSNVKRSGRSHKPPQMRINGEKKAAPPASHSLNLGKVA